MITKPTRDVFVMKSNLEKLQVVKDYLAFEALPYREKQRIWDEWNKYYEAVKQTIVYAMFQDIRKAFASKDMAKFRELLAEMKDLREKGHIPELIKPIGTDPMTYYHDQSVLNYKSVMSEISIKKESNLDF